MRERKPLGNFRQISQWNISCWGIFQKKTFVPFANIDRLVCCNAEMFSVLSTFSTRPVQFAANSQLQLKVEKAWLVVVSHED
jgi:hypothetical protein